MQNEPNKFLSGKAAEEWEEALWEDLLEVLIKKKTRQDLKKAIEALVSGPEKRFILRRLATSVLIRQGKTYREIGEILWISSATISAIRKNILQKHVTYHSSDSFYKEKKLNKINNTQKALPQNYIEKALEKLLDELLEGRLFSRPNDYFTYRARKGK